MTSASDGPIKRAVCTLFLLLRLCVVLVESYSVVVPESAQLGDRVFNLAFSGARRYRIDAERTPPIVLQLVDVDNSTGVVSVSTSLYCDALLYPNPFVVYVESLASLGHHVDFTSTALQVFVSGPGCSHWLKSPSLAADSSLNLYQNAVSVALPTSMSGIGHKNQDLCLTRGQFMVHFRDLLPVTTHKCGIKYLLVSDPRFAIEPSGDDLVSLQDQCIREPIWQISILFELKCPQFTMANLSNQRLIVVFHKHVARQSEIQSRIRREMSNQAPVFDRPSYKVRTPEDVEAGQLVTTLSAVDPEEDNLQYSMVAVVDSRSQEMFSLNAQSGTVTTLQRLDREMMPVHHFQVRAVDSGSPPRTATTTLLVLVQDANDHSPVFEHDEYETTVRESITLGSTVLTVRATDSDQGDNARIVYSILNPHDSNEAFHIDPQSGNIVAHLPLDRETQDSYMLQVQASDQALPAGRKSSTTRVLLHVTDDNDNYPQFDNKSYAVQIAENIDASSQPVIARIRASDADDGENARIRYAIIGGNTLGHFSIDPSTGDVTVNKPLDHERVKKFRLNVRAQDGGLQSRSNSTVLLIDVLDVNDNAPRFYSSHFDQTVQENVQTGYSIVRVQAYDRDAGLNAKVHYSLRAAGDGGGSGSAATLQHELPFSVDAESGWVRTRRPIDREQQHEYRMLVVATDSGQPPLSASASVTVRVHDQNDNSPVFEQKTYETSLSESAAVGTPLLSVTATDPDSEERLIYQLSQGNTRGRFGITSQNGVGLLALVQPLDFKMERHFVLKVTAADSGGRMDSATVFVNVTDANTHAPVFDAAPYSTTVFEDTPVGSRVIQLVASDHDTGENARVTYTMSGAPQPEFSVDPTSGEIFTAQPLDSERRSSYLLTVSARDHGSPSMSDTTDVEILVADVNDNAPQFSQRSYQASVSEDADAGISIVAVSASDVDQGLNGRVRYTFDGGNNGDGAFTIDPSSGQIRTSRRLDRELVPRYTLVALAVDQGSPEMSSTVEVIVDVDDINDSPPVFDDDKLRLEVKENSPIGSFVGKIVAHDPDEGVNAVIDYTLVEASDSAAFKLKTDPLSETAELYTNQEFDYESDKKVYILMVLAQSLPLQSYVTVEVHLVDVNDNAPQLSDFKVIFNNYKQFFPTTPIGRVPATDADVTDQLVYTVRSGNNANLITVNSSTGDITLSSSLNTNVPKIAKMEISVADGLNEVSAELQLTVRLITDHMLHNSVTVHLAAMTAHAFLSPHIYALFTDGLAAVLAVPRHHIIVFSVLDDFSEKEPVLNVSFSALSARNSDEFIDQQTIRENIYLKRKQLTELTTLQILPFDDNLCVNEPCANFERCVTVLAFGNASSFIEGHSTLFRPIVPVTRFSCRCPHGFAGMREVYQCDVEVDLCYSQPCHNGGTCVRREGGYSCLCAIGYAGDNCQFDMGHGRCPSHHTHDGGDICAGTSHCTDLKHGGFLCDNCVSSPYHSTFCQLTARSFRTGSFLTLPAIRQRHRFNLQLQFATRSGSGLLLYNGRLNELHDFICLELVHARQLRFSYSVGGATQHVTVNSAKPLSDGNWHHVEIDYLNRTVVLLLDYCDRQLGLQNDSPCANKTSIQLGRRCWSSEASCQRFLDLTGPLQVGGLPSHAQLSRQAGSSSFTGCINKMKIDHQLVDFHRYVVQNNTEAGCAAKAELCASRPCYHGGTCSEAWGTFQCACTAGFTGKQCQQVTESARRLHGDGYVEYAIKRVGGASPSVTLPWFTALAVRTRQHDALLLQVQLSGALVRLELESGMLVYSSGSDRLTLQSAEISDGRWHHVQLKWMAGEVWISVDYGVHEMTFGVSSAIGGQYVEQVLAGGLVESRPGDPTGLTGCIRDVSVGVSVDVILSVAAERATSSGCVLPDGCQTASCPANSVCEDVWGSFHCRCLPGHTGVKCRAVCELQPCHNNATCVASASDRRGYTCQCSSPLTYGDYCENSREQPCPSKWWGLPVCGPCNCSERAGYDPDCDKHSGQCRCKKNHYKPASSDVCLPCACYSTGSVGNACHPDTGQCECRRGVIGRRCDACSHPFSEVTRQQCQVIYTGCPRSHEAGVLWPRTEFDTLADEPCPVGADGRAHRRCRRVEGWSAPDLSKCLSTALKHQEDLVRKLSDGRLEITPFLAVSSGEQLRAALQRVSASLYVHDVYYVYKLVHLLLQHENNQTGLDLAHTQDTNFIPNIMWSVSVILRPEYSRHWRQIELQLDEGARHLVAVLDNYIGTLVRSQRDTYTSPLQVVTENIVLGLDVITAADVAVTEPRDGASVPAHLLSSARLPFSSTLAEDWMVQVPKYNNYVRSQPSPQQPMMARVMLPVHLLKLAGNDTSASYAVVGYIQYSSLSQLLPLRYAFDVRQRWGVGARPASPLLSLAVSAAGDGQQLLHQLSSSYQLQLPVAQQSPAAGIVQCVRWQPGSQTSGRGEWTRRGCRTSGVISASARPTNSNNSSTGEHDTGDSYVVCSCRHLSSFAVLIDEPSAELRVEASAMERVATYTGMSVSLLLLALAWLVFCSLRGALQTNSNSIHKNLSFCLLFCQLLFLTALKQRSQLDVDQFACKFLAIGQHYVWLCAFSWLLVESVHVLRMLTEMRDVNHGAMKLYYTLGYALPAVIVALTVGVRADQYGNVFFCWLSMHEPVIWSMVAPVFLLVSATLVHFVMAIRASFTLKDHVEGFGNLRSLLWLAVVLLPLMSAVWGLSILLASSGHSFSLSCLLSASSLALSTYLLAGYCLLNARVRRALCHTVLCLLRCRHSKLALTAVNGASVVTDGGVRGLSGTRTTLSSRAVLNGGVHGEMPLRFTAGGGGAAATDSTSSRSTCRTSSSPYSAGINAPSTTSNSRPSSLAVTAPHQQSHRHQRHLHGGRSYGMNGGVGRGGGGGTVTSDSESDESTAGRASYSLASSHTSDDEQTVDTDHQGAPVCSGGSQLRIVDRPPNIPPPPLPQGAGASSIAGPPACLSWMTSSTADRLSVSTTQSDAELRCAPHLSHLPAATAPLSSPLRHSSLSVNTAALRVRGSPLHVHSMTSRRSPALAHSCVDVAASNSRLAVGAAAAVEFRSHPLTDSHSSIQLPPSVDQLRPPPPPAPNPPSLAGIGQRSETTHLAPSYV